MTLTTSAIPGAVLFRHGKVREVYEAGPDRLVMVASDRLSAFDVVLPTPIPDKGRVLTQLSNFWFGRTAKIVPNHLLETDLARFPAPFTKHQELAGRAVLVKRAERIDYECVARGYLAGSGWAEYRKSGTVAGERLPPGLQESARLDEPIFTPATKAITGHDENISRAQLAAALGRDLAKHGHHDAHEAVRRLTLEADRSGKGMLELAALDPELKPVLASLTPDERRVLDQPEEYRGLAADVARDVATTWRARLAGMLPE